jgi:biotin carboxylase
MTTSGRPLLLGVDRYVLRACERRDAPAVLVYGPNWRDSGIPRLSANVATVFTEDERSPEAVLSALTRAGLSGEQFTSVSTTNEFALVNAAVLARILGCSGPSPEVAVRFRDKFVQKEVVRNQGIPAARSLVVQDLYDDIPSALPFERCVIKPVMGAATRQTATLSSVADLRNAVRDFRSQSRSARTFVIEEFQQGDEWLVDGVVHDGEVIFYSVAEYTQPCLRAVEVQAPLEIRRFDPRTESWTYKLAEPVIHAAVAALGLTDGVFHMELFHDNGEVFFSECAARRGGALVHEQVECKFGVDLGDAALSLALGERPDVSVTESPGIVGSTYIKAPPGVLFRVPSREEVMSLPGVEYAVLTHSVGATLPASISDTTTRVGQVMLRTSTVEEFHRRTEEVLSWFDSRVTVVPPGIRVRELRAMQPDLGYTNELLAMYRRQEE